MSSTSAVGTGVKATATTLGGTAGKSGIAAGLTKLAGGASLAGVLAALAPALGDLVFSKALSRVVESFTARHQDSEKKLDVQEKQAERHSDRQAAETMRPSTLRPK